MKYTNQACTGYGSRFLNKWISVLFCIIILLSTSITVAAQDLDSPYSNTINEENTSFDSYSEHEIIDKEEGFDSELEIEYSEILTDAVDNTLDSEVNEEFYSDPLESDNPTFEDIVLSEEGEGFYDGAYIINEETDILSDNVDEDISSKNEIGVAPLRQDDYFFEGYVCLKSEASIYRFANRQELIGYNNSSAYVFAEKQDDKSCFKIYFDTTEKRNTGEDIYIAFVEKTDIEFLSDDEQYSIGENISNDSNVRYYNEHLIPLIEFVENEAGKLIDEEESFTSEALDSIEIFSLLEDSENEYSYITPVATATESKMTEAPLLVDEVYSQEIANNQEIALNPYFTRTGIRSIKLEWQPVQAVDYYEVYINDGGEWRRKNKISETSVSYNYLSFGQEYQYKVRAHIDLNGNKSFTPFSDVVNVVITDMSTTIDASIISRKSVLLTWNGVAEADYYEVYRMVGDSGTWSRNKIVYESTSSAMAITQDTQYQYKIRAHINTGSVTYFGAFSAPISVVYSTPSISGFCTETSGFTKLDFSWNTIDNADYYEVYRKIGDDGTWTRNKKITESIVKYSLSVNKIYYFKVRAHIIMENDSFYTPFTDVFVFDTKIPNMREVILENTDAKKFNLSWSGVEYSDYYEVYRLTDKDGDWRRNQVIYDDTTKEYTVNYGTFYGYKVRARLEKDGERVYTTFSDPIYVWNIKAPIISADAITSGTMTISWESIPLADKYNIYADGGFVDSCSDTSFSMDSTYVGSQITVSAILLTNETEIESDQSEPIIYEIPAVVNYRALVIGETAYSSRLNGPDNDMNFMSAMLNGLSNDYDVIAQENATLEEIIDLIDIAFEGATENDVSLFYYSGHGVTGSTEYYSGALQTVDYQYISTMDLAEMLSVIPGKVIVILDSCGSGATISDGTENIFSIQSHDSNLIFSANEESEEDELLFDAEQFNNGVIDAFSSYDSVIRSAAGTSRPGGPLKAGELKQTKFHVITGSAYEENSLTTQIDGVWGGVLTRGIAYGTGCTYPGGIYSGSMPADTNLDNGISFSELATYCSNYAGDTQHVLSYSASSNYIFIQR